ncbi:hypothetical protein SAMN05444156_1152 [Verrucomicrobium sp. GAS474]|uniref:hypothetical protein n=1 Tax=Verrucomicrobium sp. GAS474 TaxID=1882831 RepID=UPI000879A947|nr:hypothetical protein [Verrucomicrobium sp. GAS474]SDT97002.1 hypothetical protein SAMN05444156_1152 [Verrucomicrobium sp. GAS474]
MAIQVSSSGKTGIVFLLFFALLWNGIWITTVVKKQSHLMEGGPQNLLFLLFPLIGIGIVVFLIRTIGSALRHGKTRFESEEEIPAFTLGAPLKGTIRFDRPQPSPPSSSRGYSYLLTLSCTESSGSGKDRSTTTVWTSRHPATALPDGTIPVSFLMPGENEIMSRYGQSGGNIAWTISVADEAKSFFAFSASYSVPVAPRELTPMEQSATETARIAHRKEVEAYRPPATSRIVVRASGIEGTEFYFPAGLNAKMAPFLGVMILVFGGVAFLIWKKSNAPFFFPLIFGLVAVILVYSLAQTLFGTIRTVAGPEGLVVTRSLLGWTRTKRIAAAGITRFKTAVLMTSGGKAYHTIQAVCGEKTVNLSPNLGDLLEAEALAGQIGKCVGGERA